LILEANEAINYSINGFFKPINGIHTIAAQSLESSVTAQTTHLLH
jgi:hypothetical protein